MFRFSNSALRLGQRLVQEVQRQPAFAKDAASLLGRGHELARAPLLAAFFNRSLASMVNLEVPQMGDSITEGSIASVLKQVGESVGEDEVVVQIETDKVTIDVRAPSAGRINAVLVGEDDTVVVGQHIATIEEGAEGTAVSAESPPAAAAPAAAVEVAVEAAAPAMAEEAVVEERRPLIHFPVRRTPDGQVISQLSCEEQAKYNGGHGAAGGEAPTFAAATAPIFTPLSVNDASWRNYQPNYDDHISRRGPSEREIESIMLGGAAD
mmetsp:Transcript_6992/g.17180  ORF Transcript_6992/g.17180 Transcript_6992/m.17180 type:complete len:266 (-) Transcript_6992:800-1597(-)